jgi:hypothetical protein
MGLANFLHFLAVVDSDGSTVVKHLPHYPKAVGLSLASAAGGVRSVSGCLSFKKGFIFG